MFFWKMDVIIYLIKVKNTEVGCKYKDKFNESAIFLAGTFEFYTVF